MFELLSRLIKDIYIKEKKRYWDSLIKLVGMFMLTHQVLGLPDTAG